MNKTKTYYQPYLRWNDNESGCACNRKDDEGWELPDELMSFHAFATKGDAEAFVANMSYSNYELKIEEYHDDDIEGVTIIDEYGEVIEINEDDAPMSSKKIYVIDIDDLYEQDADGNDIYPSADELTDEEFIELSNGWRFDTIEDFINAFNTDANDCPVPSQHYLRII